MSRILNYAGRLVDPLDIKKEDLRNAGMQCAVTLSRVHRFWGQGRTRYTVAQHCLSMVELYPNLQDLQKWALAHEVYEALTGIDLPSPLKKHEAYRPYREAEMKTLELFAQEYDLAWPIPELIVTADRGLLVMEAEMLMPYSPEVDWRKTHGDPMGVPYRIGATEEEVKELFLAKWIELFGKL